MVAGMHEYVRHGYRGNVADSAVMYSIRTRISNMRLRSKYYTSALYCFLSYNSRKGWSSQYKFLSQLPLYLLPHYSYVHFPLFFNFFCQLFTLHKLHSLLSAGTALLVRQYFMEPDHWAAVCNRDHYSW